MTTREHIIQLLKEKRPYLEEQYKEIPWKSMAGISKCLIHDYFGVNLDIVLQVGVTEPPGEALSIEEILRRESTG